MREAIAAPSAAANSQVAPLLDIEGLGKVYPGGQRALDDVSLRIERAEIVAVIGSSGAGKSTLIRCINRLVEPSAGRVRLNGIDLVALSRRELRGARRRIGMIFQEFNLIERLSVIDTLALDSPKTKLFARKIKDYGFTGTVLVVTEKLDENLFLGSRNLPNVLVLETREVDPVSLVRFNHVLLTKGAVTQFEELMG